MSALQDKILGCMVGGAVGDALGYAVEFSYYDQIIAQYGKKGINRYALNPHGLAEISDDTQMTMFTASGLINSLADGLTKDENLLRTEYIKDAYIDWYKTQTQPFGSTAKDKCPIMQEAALYHRRAPGNTCMSALYALSNGNTVRNDSKGCGGIMRVAPIAIFGAVQGLEPDKTALLGCDAAYLTHQHPLGWLPAGLMVYALQKALTHQGVLSRTDFANYVYEGLDALEKILKDIHKDDYDKWFKKHMDVLSAGTHEAIELSGSAIPDIQAVSQLGQGWTGEEAWFISLYCVLRHFDSFEDAVVAAVNHSGDSDSTGAIAGNIAGAILGYDSIPEYYKSDLELRPVIESLAKSLMA